MSRAVMQQALDALEEYEHHTDDPTGIAVAALRAELAKPEPEPLYRSDEEAKARKELREQLMDAAGRSAFDSVVKARLTRMAEELK